MINHGYAVLVAKKVVAILEDRSGFDGWWDDIDDDIQNEILERIAKVIETEVNGG